MQTKKKSEIIFLLGSNKGDKKEYLSTAKKYLTQEFGLPIKQSNIHKTTAIGFDGKDFLNQIIIYNSAKNPFEILAKTQEIEKRMGREKKTKEGIYQDRIIDIDLLFFDNWFLKSHLLKLPHPQIFSRPFVATLLNQIVANIQHLSIKKKILELKKR